MTLSSDPRTFVLPAALQVRIARRRINADMHEYTDEWNEGRALGAPMDELAPLIKRAEITRWERFVERLGLEPPVWEALMHLYVRREAAYVPDSGAPPAFDQMSWIESVWPEYARWSDRDWRIREPVNRPRRRSA